MKSEKSKYIRRYLRSISDKVIISKYYTSYHYYIDNIHIRFGDHFSDRSNTCDLDIIKSGEFYVFKTPNFSYTTLPEHAIKYLKAFLLVGPEFIKQQNDMLKVIRKKEVSMSKINQFETILKQKDTKIQSLQDKNAVLADANNRLKQGIRAYIDKFK